VSDAPVTIELPRVLAELTGGERRYQVTATTLRGALLQLIEQRPGLGDHLFDEAGELRRHVLCLCNREFRRARDGLDVAIAPGDTVTILHSVSGG
jgi:molybdopterin synthase sulfur carrier subunit